MRGANGTPGWPGPPVRKTSVRSACTLPPAATASRSRRPFAWRRSTGTDSEPHWNPASSSAVHARQPLQFAAVVGPELLRDPSAVRLAMLDPDDVHATTQLSATRHAKTP